MPLVKLNYARDSPDMATKSVQDFTARELKDYLVQHKILKEEEANLLEGK